MCLVEAKTLELGWGLMSTCHPPPRDASETHPPSLLPYYPTPSARAPNHPPHRVARGMRLVFGRPEEPPSSCFVGVLNRCHHAVGI